MKQQHAATVTTMSKEMRECIDACMTAHRMCEETMSSCMRRGGQAEMQVMRALMDCADMTRICADMMMRGSDMMTQMCRMCAEACSLCAEACSSMPDDPQMARCAEACRRCADMCGAMA
ncbi:four-helix bundle copper-binding protein [Streptomyces ipomoeae]|jgi:hypothetical protein|uniref:Ferredoxin n=2 Tax=Streptomyces ipomoeae TaxID=103232 RepID=L1L4J3_9ACTN|nr:four-helix bundle copper-binding protein [Streptomyces ipomoeae]EKX67714.1 hypothetical protein STRIP9103_03709 [Streptomyces ipomoeae 91-03]MDX2694991.1 four-helix bundle copper-binding protein [Streptomyces ipomoeae]MDX2823475.1 four-helix bundle copper-binding protein [Streptomyces ipomoeae]MDX2840908.1 four-helix bundle copper-binding protein [Streptomyces ipomoeae]MDX2874703.1 four-helix bundle copper-binding protein [Streptomyces ipomoeae]